MTTDSTVTLVTVSYNSETNISELLTLLSPNDALNIVVVSNSGDCASLESTHKCQVIQPGANIGFAGACNLGSTHADSEFLLFCNPDVRLTYDVVRALCNAMHTDRTIGLLSPMFAGGIHASAEATFQSTSERVPGACSLLRSSLFRNLGGWDDRFFLYAEDRDLCKRVRAAGFKVGYAKGVSVIHSASHSVKGASREQCRFLTRTWICSQVHYRVKHYGMAVALSYCLSQSVVNAMRWLTQRRAQGRDYNIPEEAVAFGLWLAAQPWRLAERTQFDGTCFRWERRHFP